MSRYVQKFTVAQTNLLPKQIGISYNLLEKDKDYSITSQYPRANLMTSHRKSPRSKSLPVNHYQHLVPIWERTPSILNKIGFNTLYQCSYIRKSSSDFNILAKYNNLTNLNEIKLGHSKGQKLTPDQIKVQNQIRQYSSFMKKITGIFSKKKAKPKKKPINVATNNVICIGKSPPPKIDFDAATQCKTEVIQQDAKPPIQVICPEKVEVGHKAKPPFQSKDGHFVEDRLCREMPEKRQEKLMNDFDLQQEEMQDIAEMKKNQKKLREVQEQIRTCIKNKKKSQLETCQESICIQTCIEKRRNSAKCPLICQEKKLDCTKPSIKKDQCKEMADPCRNIKPCKSVDVLKTCVTPAKKISCRNPVPKEKACTFNISLNERKPKTANPCENLETETKDCKTDKCRNIKPCKSKIKQVTNTVKDTCMASCLDLENPCQNLEKDSCHKKKSKCAKPNDDKECIINDDIQNCIDTCKIKRKTANCAELVKPCENIEEQLKSCTELEANDNSCKSNKCRNTKPCKSKKTLCCADGRKESKKKPPKGDDCGGCGSENTTSSCGGDSKSDNVCNFNPMTPKSKDLQVINSKKILKERIKELSDNIEETLEKPKINVINYQIGDRNSYSKINLKTDNSKIISANLDVMETSHPPDVAAVLKCPTKRFLSPAQNTAISFQLRDSRSSALSNSNLKKIFGIKYPLPHHLGRIPEPPPTNTGVREYCYNSSTEMSKTNSPPNVFCNIPAPPPVQKDPRKIIEQKDPRKVIELRDPTATIAAIIEDISRSKIEDPVKNSKMFLKDDGKDKTNCDVKKEDLPDCKDTLCKKVHPEPCCKKDKQKCCEPEKPLPPCKNPPSACDFTKDDLPPCKPVTTCGQRKEYKTPAAVDVCEKKIEKKEEKCFDPKDCKLCNFDKVVKVAENFKKEICKYTVFEENPCPTKKKTLCCYQKKEKPEMKIDECCKTQICTIPKAPDFEIPLCKKFDILDLPPQPKPKPSKCVIKKCSKERPCPGPNSPPPNCCKKLPKRPDIFCPKCPKPVFPKDPPKEKKKPVSVSARCTKMPCYQTKCTKKKPTKAPCPTPIKPPKFEDIKPKCEPMKCHKKSQDDGRLDEIKKKQKEQMCAKRCRPKSEKCVKDPCHVKSACNKKDKKALEKEEKERQEKEAKEKAYAALKHTNWKAVPIQGKERWCQEQHVEKRTDVCKSDLSTTVLPSTDEKYVSPRFNKTESPKGSCASTACPKKKGDKPNTRKMSSCSDMEYKFNADRSDIRSRYSCPNFENDFE